MVTEDRQIALKSKWRWYGLMLAIAFPWCALAADNLPSKSSTVTVIFENDLFGGSDSQYTNGIQIGWLSSDLRSYDEERRLPRWFLPIVARLPFINGPDRQYNVGFTLGQQTFTPEDIKTPTLIVDDRPYAGWLYGGLALVSKNEIALDTLQFQLGVIGPASLAEEAQDLVHDLRDIPTAKGWDNQLHNKPGVALIYQHKHRVWRSPSATGWSSDLIAHGGGVLGNVYTFLNAGGEFRFGWNGPGRLRDVTHRARRYA